MEEGFFLPVEALSEHAIGYIEQINELLDDIKGDCMSNDLSSCLDFVRENGIISFTAYIDKGTDELYHIHISENFGQYLWSVGLYLTSYFDNCVQIPMMNIAGVNAQGYEQDLLQYEFARETFFRARRLIDHFDRSYFFAIPNIVFPESYKDSIGNANAIYCGAIAFIYTHEFAHNYLGHTHIQNTYKYAIQDEIHADITAIDYIKDVFNSEYGVTYKVGIVIVMASLLLMGEDSISGNGTHPDMDVRIEKIMQSLDLSEMDNIWGLMGAAIRMWLLDYNGITTEEDSKIPGFDTHKEMYEFYLGKLRDVRQQRFPKIVNNNWDLD